MPNSVISEGNTTNEAIENGLKILKVSKDMVNVKVIEEEKRSFFSILAPRVVKVELTLKDDVVEKQETEKPIKKELKKVSEDILNEAEKNVEIFLDEIISKIGENTTYKISKNEYGLNIIINGEQSSFLIGYRGETLYAFQSILSNIANKNLTEKVRIILDIEGYKEKREKTLEDLALKISKTVEKTRKEVVLEPMPAYERKIIHTTLQNSKKVQTKSIGEEPRRRVVITLK